MATNEESKNASLMLEGDPDSINSTPDSKKSWIDNLREVWGEKQIEQKLGGLVSPH